jgi:hypothetical protein
VFGWIEANYRAGKVEAKPQALDPPAAERLDEVRVPTMVMIGEVDEAGSRPSGTSQRRSRVLRWSRSQGWPT